MAFSIQGYKSQMKQREAEMSKITMSLNSNRNIVNLINQELEKEGVDQQKLLQAILNGNAGLNEYQKRLIKLKYQIEYQHPSQYNLMMFNSIAKESVFDQGQSNYSPKEAPPQPSTISQNGFSSIISTTSNNNQSFIPHQIFKKNLPKRNFKIGPSKTEIVRKSKFDSSRNSITKAKEIDLELKLDPSSKNTLQETISISKLKRRQIPLVFLRND